jgi:hypothetical protein
VLSLNQNLVRLSSARRSASGEAALVTSVSSSVDPSASDGPTRAERRAQISVRFLDALEAIVQRHRSLSPGEYTELHAELIAAEVAHRLALVRAELARIPPLKNRD